MDGHGQSMASVIGPHIERECPSDSGLELLPPLSQKSAVDHLQALWQERRFLLRWAKYGLLLSTLVAFLIPPRYESVTRLMPPDPQNSSAATMLAALSGHAGDLLGSVSGVGSDLLGLKTSGALFIGVLRSRTVEDALITRFDLRKLYWIRRWEDARQELEDRTSLREDRKSGIIEIRIRDRSPQRAQAMGQVYVEELNRAVNTVSTSAARREREFLENRLNAVKQDLDQAASDFSQFASKNSAIDIPAQGKAMVEAAARLQGALIAAEAQRQALEQIYTPNNVRVRAVQGQVSELRRQLEKLGGAGVGDEAGKSSEDPLYPSIRKLPLLGVTYADLYRRTKIQEAVYETLTKQYELAKVQEAKEIPAVKVLDAPSYPERRASPPRLLIIAAGTLFCLALGCAWILGRTTWDETDPQDPRKLLAEQVSNGLRRDVAGMRLRLSPLLRRLKFRSPEKNVAEQA